MKIGSSLGRVGVIAARPGGGAALQFVTVHDSDDGSVGTGCHEESSYDNHKYRPADHELPLDVALGRVDTPVVVEPHESHWLER